MDLRHATVTVLVLGVVLVLSGASVASPHTPATDPATSALPDPREDTIGWEGGYWYNESIGVNQSDGLSKSELDVFLARSMARVERIRELEFTEPVTVEFVTREELSSPRNDTFGLSTNPQLWEAMFIYGEDVNTVQTIRQAQRSVVLGYAAEEGADHIVIVDPTPHQPTVGGPTLIHELVHMLQDQQFDLTRQRYLRSTLDGEAAKNGLVEGEAAYITAHYSNNCQTNWQCVGGPPGGTGAQQIGPYRFHQLTYFPYSVGEEYVRALIKRGGWDAVSAAHESPPNSTEQVIHPVRSDEQPTPMTVTDTARNGWKRVGMETVGEAGVFVTLWRPTGSNSPISEANSGFVSRPSTGWGNDSLSTYTNGNKRGYVWKTVWDTERDAREFRDAYVAILEAEGAVKRDPTTWRIENGPFADSFSVRRNGSVVTIVNGPTLGSLSDIRPALERPAERTPQTTATTGSGFGGLIALLAVVGVGMAIALFRR